MRSRLRISLLAAAVAAAATPALAASYDVYTPPLTYYYGPATTTTYYVEPAPRVYYYEPATTTYYPPSTTTYYTAPVDTVYVEPAVVVEAPRYYSDDARITDDVVATIAGDSRISGNIGVSTYRNQVELTGRVTSPNQVEWAGQDARSIPGVEEVNNRLRARVGG